MRLSSFFRLFRVSFRVLFFVFSKVDYSPIRRHSGFDQATKTIVRLYQESRMVSVTERQSFKKGTRSLNTKKPYQPSLVDRWIHSHVLGPQGAFRDQSYSAGKSVFR